MRDTDVQGIFEQEVRNADISGTLRQSRTAPSCNVIESALTSFDADSVDFTRCDFKDDVIRDSRFLHCVFTSTSMLFNSIVNSLFDNCSFHDTVIQDCDFDQVTFLECDLRHILVKACRFSRCEFRNCTTSNKVFEMCRFGDCIFTNTELQIDTLAENFGLTAKRYQGPLRDTRKDRQHRVITLADLSEWLKTAPARPLHKLNVDYFLKGTLLDGSPYLDASLDLASWAPMFRTAGSFVLALNQWIAFSLWLYEQGAAMAHTIICLHSMTGQLLQTLQEHSASSETIAAVSGAHISLARVIDEYLVTLQQSREQIHTTIVFLVEGDGTKKFYYRRLAALFRRADAKIITVKPHNSPWELLIRTASHSDTLIFMALFLATRTRIELSRVSHVMATPKTSSTKRGKRNKLANQGSGTELVPSGQPFLTLEFGGNLPIGSNPSLRLKAYLPGNLLAELKLNIRSQQVSKLRKILKGVLLAN